MDYWWKQAAEAEKAATQAAAQTAARQRGDDEPNYQIRRLLEVLAEARKKLPAERSERDERTSRVMFPIFITILIPLFSFLINVVYQLEWLIYYWVILDIALWSLFIGVFVADYRYRDRIKREIINKISNSGLIEKLALGLAAFPDIYTYTPWPWRFFLGAKPRTFPEQVKLVAQNVEWYLLDEPQLYIRMEWIIRAVSLLPSLVVLITVFLFSNQIFAISQGARFFVFRGIVLLSVAILPISVLASYPAMKHRAALDVLCRQCQERFGGSEEHRG